MQSYVLEMYIELKKNYKTIKTTYNLLSKTNDIKIPTHSAGQWLLDNMYIIEQEYNYAHLELANKIDFDLPNVKPENGKEQFRALFMANEIIEKNEGIVTSYITSNYIKNFQKHSYLSFNELTVMPLMLRLALIKFIKRICINIFNAEMQKLKVEKKINNTLSKDVNKIATKTLRGLGKLKEELVNNNKVKVSNTAYIEYMAYRLKDMGKLGENYLNDLKEETNKVGYTIDEAIEKEHNEVAKTTYLISNAICSMKQISLINWEDVIVKINRIDEELIKDYTNEYELCGYKTKARYRNRVISLAKKYNVSEMYIAKKAVSCSIKYKKHIGHFLIGEDGDKLLKSMSKSTFFHNIKKKIIMPSRPIIYILLINLFGLISLIFLDKNYTSKLLLWQRIIIGIIMYALGMELGDKLISYIVGKFIRPKFLPRFDYSKSIPEQNSTLIAMPTVVNSLEKLEKMVKKMEVTYLANRSKNMYYMLLGDCISSNKENIELDDKIIEHANKLINNLNNKYPSSPKLFNYIYRKRVYSKGEKSYMGWERKRGALTQLNKLLLGRLSDGEIFRSMYLGHNDLPKVKYLITIDEDTALSLNSAKELVAIISHPLNKPILSKNNKRVVSGYGLIQPAIGLDIESANKSIFSKVFGGFGGLDIYTNAISNLYQDVFKEAIFTGKGIYNIELFDNILGNAVPENLVLSHDLLEGSFLRTGLASDVELQDGFPSNFIAYMKRNHRWYRGDIQIVSWLLNPKSGINLLSRWKIFDNLRRESLDILAFIYMVISLIISGKHFMFSIIIIFVSLNFGYILSTIDQLLFGRNAERKQKQYIPVIYGLRANLLKMVFNIITIPYKAYIAIHAFCTSLYRMYISKKKLLEWATAESVEHNAKEKLYYVTKHMWPNVSFAIVIIAYTIFSYLGYINNTEYIFPLIMAFFYLIAPYSAYIMSKRVIFKDLNVLSDKEKKVIIDLGKDTWKFFEENMTQLNNYLPPDNYQEDRRPKIVVATSPTNIGFGIMAIINAYDLKYISLDSAIRKLNNTLETVNKLEKWNGHLYNWYNIRTLEIKKPKFISSVDSGNFIASLFVLKDFILNIEYSKLITDVLIPYVKNILDIVNNLINSTNFIALYCEDKNLFSIGFDIATNKLVDSYYDMLMSEARLTSMIAIASSKVTSKHWFVLARNLVKADRKKGLISWSGTSFEYFMPNLFTKTYKYTLIDESLNFSMHSQMKYAKTANDIPWGVSESGFAIQDDEQNYQYKAFGVPWLGLKRGLNDNMVVSPYASLLCLDYKPKAVFNNIKKLKKYNLYSNYGFYEAIDFTKKHIGKGNKFTIVKTYMSHHQGMILTAINNYINNDIIKERFHNNPSIAATEILLKERVPLSVPIKENLLSKYNKFIQLDKSIYTSHICFLDEQAYMDEKKPSINIHTNGKLNTLILSNGINYITYNGISITKNRFISNKTTGNTIFFTDKTSGKTWSSAYEPNYIKPFDYSVDFSLGTTKFYRRDGYIETQSLICISPRYNMEIRKFTLKNNSKDVREIVINTELEIALSYQQDNVVHPAFNNLLIEEYYDEELETLIAKKRTKDSQDKDIYLFTKLVGIDLAYEIETEKSKLIQDDGRSAFDENIVRYPLSPVMAYRARILLDPNEEQSFYYLTGVTNSKYDINYTIVNADKDTIEDEINYIFQRENINAKYLKLEHGKVELYNKILADALINRKHFDSKISIWNESYNQSMLWKYGISGDLPIITSYIGKIEDYAMIQELIRFMDFVKSRKIDVDIVILVDEEEYSGEPIKKQLLKILEKVIYMSYTRGDIYVVNLNNVSKQEKELFSYISSKKINNIEEFMPKIINDDNKTKKEGLV